MCVNRKKEMDKKINEKIGFCKFSTKTKRKIVQKVKK